MTDMPERPATMSDREGWSPGAVNLEPRVEGANASLRQGATLLVRGEHVELHQAGAGFVLADDDVTIERGGARTAIAGEGLTINQAGAGLILAGGDARILQGGAGTLVVLGGADIEQGGAVVLLTPEARIRGGIVGVAIAGRLNLEDGARVLAGPRELGIVAAIGAAFAFLLILARRG